MSDHNERSCTKCGSLLHHENDCKKQQAEVKMDSETSDHYTSKELETAKFPRTPKQPEGVKLNACVKCGKPPKLEVIMSNRLLSIFCCETYAFGSSSDIRNKWNALNPTPAQADKCEHKEVYYSRECDNFYCRKCKAGQGNAFHEEHFANRNLPIYREYFTQPDERAEVEKLVGHLLAAKLITVSDYARFILSREQPLRQRIDELEAESTRLSNNCTSLSKEILRVIDASKGDAGNPVSQLCGEPWSVNPNLSCNLAKGHAEAHHFATPNCAFPERDYHIRSLANKMGFSRTTRLELAETLVDQLGSVEHFIRV